MNFFLIILLAAATGFFSMIGGFLLLSGNKFAKVLQKLGPFIAVITLAYAVFGDIVPEILEEMPPLTAAILIAAGFVICIILDKLMEKFFGHVHHDNHHHNLKNKQQAYSMLLADSIHTAADGVVLGATFAADPVAGIATAASIAAHEIPQEIGDFSIFQRAKIPPQKIIKLQAMSAFILIPTSALALIIGDILRSTLPTVLALTAGFLLHIATSEIMSIIKNIKSHAPRVKELN